MKPRVLVAALVVGSTACSTHPVVTDISGLRGTGADLPGLPFRVKSQQVIHIFKYDEVTDKYNEVAVVQQLLTEQSKLYALNYRGDVFANRGLNISENADNTLKSMEVSSTSGGTSSLIDSATTTLTGVTSAENTKKAANLTTATAVVTADNAVTTAQTALDGLPSTISPDARSTYQNALESAKRADNAARISAGQAPLYP